MTPRRDRVGRPGPARDRAGPGGGPLTADGAGPLRCPSTPGRAMNTATGRARRITFDGEHVTIRRRGLPAALGIRAEAVSLPVGGFTAVHWKPATELGDGFLHVATGGAPQDHAGGRVSGTPWSSPRAQQDAFTAQRAALDATLGRPRLRPGGTQSPACRGPGRRTPRPRGSRPPRPDRQDPPRPAGGTARPRRLSRPHPHGRPARVAGRPEKMPPRRVTGPFRRRSAGAWR